MLFILICMAVDNFFISFCVEKWGIVDYFCNFTAWNVPFG